MLKRKPLVTIAFFALAAAIAGLLVMGATGGCGGSNGTTDEAAVRSANSRELELVKKEDWRAMYQMVSPRARSACPYDEFLKLFSSVGTSGYDWSQIAYDEVKVRLAGDTAYVTYITTYEGKDVDATTDSDPDVWVKIGGKWYDDNRGRSSCEGSSSGNRPIPAVSPEPGAASSSAATTPGSVTIGDTTVDVSGWLPSGFPSDFPVYPGASVAGSAKGPQGDISVTWTSGDRVDEVAEFYRKQFRDGPWKSDTWTSGDGGFHWVVTSPDGKLVGKVTAAGANGKTLISAFVYRSGR